MTNGEKMISAFPNGEVRKIGKGVVFTTGGWCHAYSDEWWNAECEEPTTQNDLAVDCISRADAIQAMQDKAKKLTNEDTINGLCGAVAILFELPSATPQLSVPEVTALAEWTAKLTKASEDAYNKGYADGMKEQEPRWIPVKTINQCYIPELKDYHGKVIATYLTGKHIKPQVTTISISYGRIENKKYTDIVAIMYLPEPYSEVEE